MRREDLVLLLSEIMGEERAALTVDRLLMEFGTPERIVSADPCALLKVKGMDEGVLSVLRLSVDLAARRRMEFFHFGQMHGERDIARYLSGLFLGVSVETIVMLSLDKNRAVIAKDLLGVGTVNASTFNLRRALEIALRRDAKYVVLAHNHPSGLTNPSKEDVETTALLKDAFRTVDIGVLAHFVIVGGAYDFVGGVSDLAP